VRFRRLRALLSDDERRRRALFLASLVALLTVVAMAFMTYRVQHLPLDMRTSSWLQAIEYSPMAGFMYAVSLPGYTPWNLIVVALGALLVAIWLNWYDSAFLLGITAFQGLANHLIKSGIGRPRPSEDLVAVLTSRAGMSFPSGHVMMYTVFFGFLFFLAWTRMPRSIWRQLVMWLTGALVLLVGPSRVYLGAHWLSDVVAGYLVSLIILLFAIEFYAKYFLPVEQRIFRATDQEEQALS
jgi:undecaprenyl-diphosphatase